MSKENKLVQLLIDRFTKSRNDICFITREDHSLTYGDFWLNADSIAKKWRKQGLSPGSIIAFLVPNDAYLPCCLLACAIGGYIACPIVPSLHQDTIENILTAIQPTLLVTEREKLEASLLPEMEYDFHITFGNSQPFLINFTSGLTGEPKAMLHCLGSIIGSAHSFAWLTGMSTHTRLYHILPMAYMAGILNTFFSPLLAGGTVIEGPLFSPENASYFWDRPIHYHVNTLSLVPSIAAVLTALTRNPRTIESIRSQLSQVQCTSAPIPLKIKQDFQTKFHLPLQDCYGITELGGPLTFQSYADAQSLTYFSDPSPAIEISIRNTMGKPELWIKSPFAMLGYYQNGRCSLPCDNEGFIDTGDLADLEDGKIRITGRNKDIIIRGGINIPPVKIENCLSQIPEVDDVSVIGVEHPFWGEEIVACIVTQGDKSAINDKILAHANRHLSLHERPDRIFYVDMLPRSFVGKVIKDQLRKQCIVRE